MAHKTGNSGSSAVAEEPKAEQPKTTVDTKEGSTEAKPAKVVKVKPNVRYRLLDGVEEKDFKGQRQVIVRSMKKLSEGPGDKTHTFNDIVAKSIEEGLSSKTPLEDSTRFHLAGLVKNKQVMTVEVPGTIK